MPKFANIFLFNRLPAPGGGGTLYYGFSGSKVTNINYSSVDAYLCPLGEYRILNLLCFDPNANS